MELRGQDPYVGEPSGLTPVDSRGREQGDAEGRVEQDSQAVPKPTGSSGLRIVCMGQNVQAFYLYRDQSSSVGHMGRA